MAKKRLAPLPRVTSKTITVGSLLGKIKRLILEEPLRLDMGYWVKVFKGQHVRDGAELSPQPACGTVACIAGWGVTLLRPNGANAKALYENADDVMTEAFGFDKDGFGGTFRTVDRLFADYATRSLGESEVMPPAGTTAHAAVIAKRIDTYLSQHPEIVNRKIVVADVQKALRA